MKLSPSRLGTALFISGILSAPAMAATVINFSDFSSVSGLQLNGSAAQAGSALRVTPSVGNQAGSVFSTNPVTLAADVSFSTRFSFRISNPGGIIDGDGIGADGLVFVVQTNSSDVGGAGGGIGYAGIPKSVGIEFDTWNNGLGSGDPDGNHVAIDTNGGLASPLAVTPVATRMNDGDLWYAWVDYDGDTDSLEVRLGDSETRPASPIASAVVDLPFILQGTNAFVGFTSGTGSAFGDHDLLSWEFRDDYEPIVTPPTGVPEAGGGLIALLMGLGSLTMFRRFAK